MPSRRDPRPSARLTRLRQRDERTRDNARAAALYAREQRECYRRYAGITTTPGGTMTRRFWHRRRQAAADMDALESLTVKVNAQLVQTYQVHLTAQEFEHLAALADAQGLLHMLSPSGKPTRRGSWFALADKLRQAVSDGKAAQEDAER